MVKTHAELKHTAIVIFKIQHEANSSKTHQTSFQMTFIITNPNIFTIHSDKLQ
ncbi:hypothetical protein PH505_bx00150 [Pseudoalteromonas distincta]|nr:hypothetical protein PH505_bx00150 [Pseudoalteromonas distincta]